MESILQTLKRGLFLHYGEVPPITTIAQDFNDHIAQVKPVTAEMIEAWLTGNAFPPVEYLPILAFWLKVTFGRRIRDDELLNLQRHFDFDSFKK